MTKRNLDATVRLKKESARSHLLVVVYLVMFGVVALSLTLVFFPMVQSHWTARRFMKEFHQEIDRRKEQRKTNEGYKGWTDTVIHSSGRFCHELAAMKAHSQGAVVVDELIAALSERDVEVRELAALSLAQIGSPARNAIPALLRLLNDENSCNVAQIALSKVAQHDVPLLMERFADQPNTVKRLILRTFGEIGENSKTAFPVILACLDDPDFNIRIAAYETLEEIGPLSGSAVSKLHEKLLEEELQYRVYIAKVLTTLTGDSNWLVSTLRDLDASGASNDLILALAITSTLGPKAEDAVPIIATMAENEDADVRAEVALALGAISMRISYCVPVLLKLANDPNAEVRDCALSVLSRHSDRNKDAADALKLLTEQPTVESKP